MKFRYFLIIFCIILSLLPCRSEEEAVNVSKEESEESSDEIFNSRTNHNHPYGKPENVLKFGDNDQFIVNNKALEDIFLHQDVKDRNIVAVSIIGAFRKGKSFLMDYALRYMYGNYKSVSYPDNPLNNTNNWMGEPNEPLKGFSWRGGVKRDTNGVIMWSDIFLHEVKDQKFAIVLMDTQGLFDTQTSPTDNSRIFALGTLASSIQIFNLNDVIQENQLEYLQLATEFSKFAMKKNKEGRRRSRNFKPFQNLIFLMRDWQNKQDYDYGEVGGMGYLTSVLQIRPDQPEALKNVRNFIKSSFEKLECFLMPHPGTIVTTDPEYEGQRSGLSEDFEEYLGKFLDYILNPKKLVQKKILNLEVTGSEYIEYLKAYFMAFESDDIPKVETLHSVTIRKQFEMLISEAFDEYKSYLLPPNFDSQTFAEDMDDNGNKSMSIALSSFKKRRKLGSPADAQNYQDELKNLIGTHFTEWKSNHIKTFENLRKIEEENHKKRLEAEELAKKELEDLQRKNLEDLEVLKREYEEKIGQMNETLYAIRTESDNAISKLRKDYEEQKRASELENEKIFNELRKQNEEMKAKVGEAQINLQQELIKMEEAAREKQKEMERMIEERRDVELEKWRIQNENKRIEFEQKLKIEELKVKAEVEQKAHEREMIAEQKLIMQNAENERKKEYEKIIHNLQEQQRQLQEIIMTSLKSG